MSQPTIVDLMGNQQFRELIEGFSSVIKTSADKGLHEARKQCTAFFLGADSFRAEVDSIQDIEINGLDQNLIALRIYRPQCEGSLPVVVYFHRGGWIFGNNEESEPICRLLACYLGCIVVAVDYRLAPEHPFPKPLEDCYAATEWVASHMKSLGGNSEKLIVCGESAGGNMAAAVALMARDRHGPSIASQLLIYPIITSKIHDAPYDECPDRYFLTKEAMQFMWNAYLQSDENARNPYASVDCAENHAELPPAVVITGEYDPLCQEGNAYAQSLLKAGVRVQTMCVPKAIHGFLDLPLYETEQKVEWIQQIGKLLESNGFKPPS